MDHTDKESIRIIQPLPYSFNIYRLNDLHDLPLHEPYVFLANTDEEISLVCPDHLKLNNVIQEEIGYQGFRIKGTLDFALTGILASITTILAKEEIPVFAVSTFNTDYVFTRTEYFHSAITVLQQNGWIVEE